MTRLLGMIFLAGILTGCVDSQRAPELRGLSLEQQQRAASNVGCAFENQKACAHIVENRVLLASFYAPKGLGGKTEDAKNRGRRLTNKFVIENTSNIKQCRAVSAPAIPLLKKLDIAGGKYQVLATTPISEQSSCYLAVDTEI